MICSSYLESLKVYQRKYPNVCITGFIPQCRPSMIMREDDIIDGESPLSDGPYSPKSIYQLKSDWIYSGGRPRVSSTPLGVSSVYTRFPVFDLSQYQTSRI